jgi:hypothetical protein
MRKQKNSIVATEVSEVIANAPANVETTETVETPKAEKAVKVPALTNEEKKAIKAKTATEIVTGCALPSSICVNFLQEGFTLYPANEAGTIAKKRAICGIDKLSVKGGLVQYFFYSNVLPVATLTEIFGDVKSVPATQKFGTGGGRFNAFIRCEASKIPALIAASLATAFTVSLLEEVANEAKKAAEKAEKTAKIATPTGEGKAEI